MSKIITITGVSEKTLTFRKNVSAIQIIMSNDVDGSGIDFVTPKGVCYIANSNKAKHKTIFDKSNLIDIVELSTIFRERTISLFGELHLIGNAPAVGLPFNIFASPKVTVARIQLDLTNGVRGVQPLDGDDVVLELTDLDTDAVYTVYVTEEDDVNIRDANGMVIHTPVLAYKYHLLSTKQERTSKITDVVGIERLAIEKSAYFNSVEIAFKDGTNIKLEPGDLLLETYDTFGDCYETTLLLGGVTLADVTPLAKIEKEPRRNWILPIAENVLSIQINVDEQVIGGVTSVPSLRLIALRTQTLNA